MARNNSDLPPGHLVGAGLVIASALVFSLAGVLTKAITADAWVIACWRGTLGGAFIAAYVAWTDRGTPLRQVFALDLRGWVLAGVGAAASLAFIFAFKMTYIANVAIVYATVPFFAAGLAWLFLRERFQRRTKIAATVSLVGVGIMVGAGLGTPHLAGDGMALLMTIGNALYLVLIRAFRNSKVILAGGVSALLLFFPAWFVTDPLAVSAADLPLLVGFGLAFAIAVILWTEGTKRIPAAESGLLGTAETPFAIILAWIVLSELPPAASFAGGAIVLVAVLAHAWVDFRKTRT